MELEGLKKDVQLLKAATALLAVSSFSLMLTLIDFGANGAMSTVVPIVTGVSFWLFLMIGYIVFFQISKGRAAFEKAQAASGRTPRRRRTAYKKKPGIICFFSNPPAVCADLLTAVLLIIFVAFLFIPNPNQFFHIFLISCLVLSFHMHCILNGINFKYIYTVQKHQKESRT